MVLGTKMKTRLLIIIGIIIAVSSLFTIAYFTNVSYDVEHCTNDTVYKDFTGKIVLREICIFPFTEKTITDTFLGCDDGFKQTNETCIKIKQDDFLERSPPPEPDTGEFRYGQQECHYTDTNGEQNSCIVEGWTKSSSELDCEEICKPPPTKGSENEN
jgi:hypothetical protein